MIKDQVNTYLSMKFTNFFINKINGRETKVKTREKKKEEKTKHKKRDEFS
jgi:hypothetical protein